MSALELFYNGNGKKEHSHTDGGGSEIRECVWGRAFTYAAMYILMVFMSSEKVIYIKNVIRKVCDATVSRHHCWAWSCLLSILIHSALF